MPETAACQSKMYCSFRWLSYLCVNKPDSISEASSVEDVTLDKYTKKVSDYTEWWKIMLFWIIHKIFPSRILPSYLCFCLHFINEKWEYLFFRIHGMPVFPETSQHYAFECEITISHLTNLQSLKIYQKCQVKSNDVAACPFLLHLSAP